MKSTRGGKSGPQQIPSLIEIEAELYRRSLGDYIRAMWPVIEPGTPYLHNWHIDAVAEYLTAVSEGQITRLLINQPPRYMKSIAVSVAWPTWRWITRPESRWLFASYSGSLSTKHSVDRRTVIQSEWYQQRWANRFALTTDQNVKTEYQNDKRGVMVATSFGGTATGKGAGAGGAIVIDDPTNPSEALSDVQRENANRIFDQTYSTRLDNKKIDPIVIVMQRLNEKDLSAHAKELGYVHLCLPAECETRTVITFPMSGRQIVREVGDLLWPEREGPKEIAQAKLQLGPYGYAGQYQQRPAPAGGGRFKREWFRYYKKQGENYLLYAKDGSIAKTVAVSDCDRFGMMDPAGTDKEQNDKACYTVIGIWDITPDGDMVKVEHWREQAETPDVADKGCEMSRLFDLPWIGVEKNGLGLGVVQTIRRRGITVKPIIAKGSKEARSETAEIRMAAGMIYFPQEAPWRFELEKELLTFPNGEYADQIDELSHAARYVQRVRGELTVVEDEPEVRPAPVHPMVAAVASTDEDWRWRQFIGSEDED